MPEEDKLMEKLSAIDVEKRGMIFPFIANTGDDIDSMYLPCGLPKEGGNLRRLEYPVIAKVLENQDGLLKIINQDGDCMLIEYGDIKNFILLADQIGK
jgi:hypothetical protein